MRQVNLAVGGDLPGTSPGPDTHFPQTLQMDYVRVYKCIPLSRVAVSGSCISHQLPADFLTNLAPLLTWAACSISVAFVLPGMHGPLRRTRHVSPCTVLPVRQVLHMHWQTHLLLQQAGVRAGLVIATASTPVA